MSRDSSEGSPVPAGEHPLVFVLLAACVGVAIDRHLAVPRSVWGAWLAMMLALWLAVRRRGGQRGAAFLVANLARDWGRPGRTRGPATAATLQALRFSAEKCLTALRGGQRGAAILVLGSVAALAGLWHHDRWRLFPADEIGRYARDVPAPVYVRVVALEPPRWSPAEEPTALCTMVQGEMTRMAVRVVALRQAAQWQPISGRVTLLVDGSLSDVLRGDTLEVAGTLVRVRRAANPGEPNMAAMWRRNRQLALLHCGRPACVKYLEPGTPWSVLRQLGRVRVWAERVLDRHIAAPQSALAAALLLGSRERLDRATVEKFFVSGTVHLLSISGSHVAILASAMWVMIRLDWFPRPRMLLFTGALAVAYALLTGAQPPVVRATILIVVYCLARWTNRRAVAWNSLAAAGLVTLVLSPGGMYDVGTQLSYLAVAVLVAQRPLMLTSRRSDPVRRLVDQSRSRWSRVARAFLRGAGQLTIASTLIWLISMPLVANRFHLVSLIGVPANLLLWLPIPVALFSGLAVLIVAPVPLLANVFGWICQQSLVLTQWLMTISAAPGWGHLWVAGPPLWLVLVFYALLAAFQFAVMRLPRRWWLALLSGWLTISMANGATAARAWRMAREQPLRCSFIAVGHGTSVLMELPDGRTILYDAGRMGSPQAAVLPICSVLWSRRIARIDAIVLSHADADHFNAVPDLLDRFSVGVVYVSPVMFANDTAALDALRASIVASDVPVKDVCEGARLATATGVEAEVLHPPPGGCRGGDNSNSIVPRIRHGSQSILLTGDLEGDGLDELLAEPSLPCDVLLAPHHGSRRSRPQEMTTWAAPSLVVVSDGAARGTDPFPSDYESLGAHARWTHRDGMIEVLLDGHGMRARSWRESESREMGYSVWEP